MTNITNSLNDQQWRKIKKDYGSVIDIILRTGNVFYRQQKYKPDNIFVIPQVRKYFTSEHGNYHTFIFDAYLAKRHMPLRSKCIMFETGPNYIKRAYPGDLYYVIPKNNAPLCYVNSHDLWTAFNDKVVNIEIFNDLVTTLSAKDDSKLSSYNDIIQFFTNMYQKIQEDKKTYKMILKSAIISCVDDNIDNVNTLYNTMINIKPNIQQWLENDVFDLNNRFNMTTPEILCKKFPEIEIEVWTDKECLVIPEDMYTEFMNEYKSHKLRDRY